MNGLAAEIEHLAVYAGCDKDLIAFFRGMECKTNGRKFPGHMNAAVGAAAIEGTGGAILSFLADAVATARLRCKFVRPMFGPSSGIPTGREAIADGGTDARGRNPSTPNPATCSQREIQVAFAGSSLESSHRNSPGTLRAKRD